MIVFSILGFTSDTPMIEIRAGNLTFPSQLRGCPFTDIRSALALLFDNELESELHINVRC